MAHRYANFDDAYDEMLVWWPGMKLFYSDGESHVINASQLYNDPVQYYEFGLLCTGVLKLFQVVNYLLHTWESAADQSPFYEALYWAAQSGDGGDPYELTLVKMIGAYTHAHDDHRAGLLMLMDAYRASMYDKPFDREYHALWIQRFKSWA